MLTTEQAVIRHKYRNQLLATPPSKQIRVLMIGNNPREMGCLSLHLRNFRWKRFSVNATFDLKEGWKIAQYFRPDYVLIDGIFSGQEIKNFVEHLLSNRSTSSSVIALLKEDNHQELAIPGIQDYLLKDNIASDTFAFDILNAISQKTTSEERRVSNAGALNQNNQAANNWFPGLMFKRKALFDS